MLNNLKLHKPEEVTLLISKASTGDDGALNSLIPLVYEDLRAIASGLRHKQMKVSATLNTTSLINEAWIRLNRWGIEAQNRKHFFCIAAKAMRQILINSATEKLSQKRKAELVTFDDSGFKSESDAQWILELDSVLKPLEKKNSRIAEVFQLRYFLGFTEKEVSEAMDISISTVNRDWLIAKKIIKEILLI